MRILHFADLHIGVENYGRPDPATGLSTRLQDFLQTLDEVVDYALAGDIDLVLFAGDAYKSRDPSQTQQREFARRIARLTGAGAPVYLLVGNHDLPYALGRATSVDIFPTLGVPLVHVADRLGTQVVQTRRGEPLQIVGVPWINRSWLLSQEEYKNLGARSLNEVMEEKLSRMLAAEFSRLDAEVPAVMAGHLAGAWAVPGSERRMTVGADPVFLPSTLRSRQGNIEYVALGHIHKQQVHEGEVPLVYSGSVQRVDFGEEGQEKGFYVVDIDPARPVGSRLRSFEFVPVRAREFVTVEVRSRSGDPTRDVLRAISRKERDVADAIVRVQVNLLREHEGLLDDTAVRRALAPAHFIAGVAREIDGPSRSRLGNVRIEELTPLRALELFLESKSTPPERTQELLEYGRRLVAAAQESEDLPPGPATLSRQGAG